MKVKEKILAIFPWSGKKSQQRQSERTRESSPGRERREGKKGEKRQGKTTGVKGDTIFYSQSESWIEILDSKQKVLGLWM